MWNEQTNISIRATSADPFSATRDLALESIAVLDTLRSVAGKPGFMVRLEAPADVSPIVATHAAAHAMLVHLFPARKNQLDAVFEEAVRSFAPDPKRESAIAFGNAVAAAVIAIRSNDGWNKTGRVVTGTEAGQWRPTPPGLHPPLNPQWAMLAPFTLTRPDQFRPPGPRAPGTQAFLDAVRQTAEIGELHSTIRTADQTQAAHYWSDAIGTYAPAGHWNTIANTVLREASSDPLRQATVLAELNIAIADAAIAMTDAKYTYWAWRPISAIQAGIPGFPAQPDWAPLLETPNHPSYVSGHSAFSAAAAIVLTDEFGARPFKADSADQPGATRAFRDFQQAAAEAADSRLWGGIHFKFDNDDGLVTGRAVGAWALKIFRSRDVSGAPIVILDPDGKGGYAMDRASPLRFVNVTIDGGRRVSVPVAMDARFTLPKCGQGRHAVAVTATGARGIVTTVQTIVSGNG